MWWKDSLQVQRLRREQHGIVKKMKKWIPDTRTYYRHLLDLETDEGKREVIQQKILSIKRTSERDYISDLTYYHHKKDMDKIKELAREWYDSGLFSHAFLFYFYNECSGLKKDAILVSDLNLGTYYRYLLQYGIGLFTDVKVVDVADLRNPTQESQLWQEVGTFQTLEPQTFADGCAEMIKYAMIWNEDFLKLLESCDINKQIEEIVAYCVDIKRQVVEQDELDSSIRMILRP